MQSPADAPVDADAAPHDDEAQQRLVETWFRRRGFASLLEGTAMHRDPAILARTLSVLFALTLVVINPAGVNWSPRLAIGGVVALIVTWVGLNLWGRRRPFAPIRTVTWRERWAFVLVPSLVLLLEAVPSYEDSVIQLNWSEVAVLTVVGALIMQAVLLWVASVIVRSGLLSAFRWLGRMVVESFLTAGAALSRTIPLLLGVVGLLYFGAEIWQSIGLLPGWAYAVVLGLFVALSVNFLHAPDHFDIDTLATFDDPAELDAILDDTPLAELASVPLPARTPLAPHHVQDLRLVAMFSRVTVVTVISLGVFAFFVVLGFVAVNADVVKAWTQAAPQVLWSIALDGRTYALTAEHLRVSAFLGVFAGFYFSVVSRTDTALREGVTDTAEVTAREACAARLVALHHFPRH
ncbi:MAG: hypothetical protein Q4F65_13170, partial [Propionibacteriaceae bacterium]|nr:hypothetical protein [Propionibacteriaceae bacterium]